MALPATYTEGPVCPCLRTYRCAAASFRVGPQPVIPNGYKAGVTVRIPFKSLWEDCGEEYLGGCATTGQDCNTPLENHVPHPQCGGEFNYAGCGQHRERVDLVQGEVKIVHDPQHEAHDARNDRCDCEDCVENATWANAKSRIQEHPKLNRDVAKCDPTRQSAQRVVLGRV